MKRSAYLLTLILMLGISSCNQSSKEDLIKKNELQLTSDRLTPEVLWSFGRVGEIAVSPDRGKVAFTLTYYSIDQDKGNKEIYIINIDGTGLKQLTFTPQNEHNICWKPDGSRIGYLSDKGGSSQIWEMDSDGSGKKQISDFQGGITGFKYSPNMSKVVFTSEVYLPEPDLKEYYEGLPKAKGKVINRMMFRHWDEWRETYSHLFLADYNGKVMSNPTDLMGVEPWDVPMKPFWGMEQVAWAPDSRSIAYSCKKKDGKSYAISTNSDIYIYDLDLKQTRNFTRGMMGYDLSPAYSPDGKYLAWESMARDGYESDKNRLIVYNLITNGKTDYTQSFDQDVEKIAWGDDSETVYFICDWYGTKEIFSVHISGKISQLTSGLHDYTSVHPAGDKLIAGMESISMPREIVSVPANGGEATQLTFINKDITDQLTMGRVEKRWIETTDNKKMLTWVIYPPHFDPSRKYAALLYCKGGPQGGLTQSWSYRWNYQIMAANEYIVVAPSRRGVSGFGQEWKEEISGDYGGQNMKDLLQAIDVMADEPYIDKQLLGAVGASYGGYSVFWLAGHHQGRFRAFIAHDGVFNEDADYLETDEQWFPNWDLGGPYWETDNPVVKESYANSPHLFVKDWDTPILIIHGQKDYRIAVTQGMSAFNAARLMGIPSQFLYFPDESHWVLSPQNGILWQRTFFKWLDRWLKPPS